MITGVQAPWNPVKARVGAQVYVYWVVRLSGELATYFYVKEGSVDTADSREPCTRSGYFSQPV